MEDVRVVEEGVRGKIEDVRCVGEVGRDGGCEG